MGGGWRGGGEGGREPNKVTSASYQRGGVAMTTRVQGAWACTSPLYQDNSWPPSQALISLENKSRHVGMYALTRFAKQEPARE